MAKRTDEELLQYHLQKAKQAENRIKKKERVMKEKQRKKENSVKFTMGGLLFKYFGNDLIDLSRGEREAFVAGWDSLLAGNQELFRKHGKNSLEKYRQEKSKSSEEPEESCEDNREENS